MGNEYSPYKMIRHYIRDGGLPSAPKQAQVILSDLCNQNCSFCAYRMEGYTSNQLFTAGAQLAAYGHNNPVRFMPTDRALALMDELKRAGVLGVQFTGGGEPTVHKDHEAVFGKCLDAGMQAALVSNGIRWSQRLKSDVLPRFMWVRVSVDAGDADTYAQIRQTPPDHWDRVWANVSSLAGWIRATGSKCLLGVGYVVTPQNWKGIIEGVSAAKDAGAANIRLSAMFNPAGTVPYKDIYEEIKALIIEARRRYEDNGFSVNDLFGERLQDLQDGSPDYDSCAYQHYTTYIGADLNVYRCCVYAYNERGLVDGGNLTSQTFDSYWASQARKDDMTAFKARQCALCQFNPKNRAMAYIMADKTVHEEFP